MVACGLVIVAGTTLSTGAAGAAATARHLTVVAAGAGTSSAAPPQIRAPAPGPAWAAAYPCCAVRARASALGPLLLSSSRAAGCRSGRRRRGPSAELMTTAQAAARSAACAAGPPAAAGPWRSGPRPTGLLMPARLSLSTAKPGDGAAQYLLAQRVVTAQHAQAQLHPPRTTGWPRPRRRTRIRPRRGTQCGSRPSSATRSTRWAGHRQRGGAGPARQPRSASPRGMALAPGWRQGFGGGRSGSGPADRRRARRHPRRTKAQPQRRDKQPRTSTHGQPPFTSSLWRHATPSR